MFAYDYTLSATAGDFPTTPAVVTIPVVVDIQDALGNDSNYSGLTATVDNLPPVVKTSMTAGTAVNGANATVSLAFTLRDVGGQVGANPIVTVFPGGIGSGNPATFVSRSDTGDTSSFAYQYIVKAADKNGSANVKIVATDAALNQLTTTQNGVFIIDTIAPAFSGLTIDHPVQKAGGTVTVTISVLECNPSGAPTIAFVNNANGTTVDSGSMTTPGSAPNCNTPATYTYVHTVGNSSVDRTAAR